MDRKKRVAQEMGKLVTLVLVLLLITATTIVFDGSITGKAVGNTGVTYIIPSIQEVDSIHELNKLNEGFYLIKEGYVFYMESADSYVPLYIKVIDLQQQNGLLSVDEDGDMEFDESYRLKESPQIKPEEKEEEDLVSVDVAGIKGISGFATSPPKQSPIKPEDKAKFDAIYKKYPSILRGTFEGLYSAETIFGKLTEHNEPSDLAAKTTGPLGITRGIYTNQKYNPNGQYNPNTLEGSLEIGAGYINDFMKRSAYDKNAPEDIRANQLQIAWNSGSVPSSDKIKQILDSPYYSAAGTFNFNENLNVAGRIARFANFMKGYSLGEKSETPSNSPSNPQQEDQTPIEVDQKKDTNGNTIFYYSDGSKMTVSEKGDVVISDSTGKTVFETSSTNVPSPPPTYIDPLRLGENKIYVDDSGDLKVVNYGPDRALRYENGQVIIPGGLLYRDVPATQEQMDVLWESAPEAMSKLQRIPYFVQVDGSKYYLQENDKVTRQNLKTGEFVTYQAKIKDGWTFLQACARAYDDECNGETVQFQDASKLDLTKCCGGNSMGFSVLETHGNPSIVKLSQNAIELKQPLPGWASDLDISTPQAPAPTTVKFENKDNLIKYMNEGETYYVNNQGQVFLVKNGKLSDKPDGILVNPDDIQTYSNKYLGIRKNQEDNGKVSYELSIIKELPQSQPTQTLTETPSGEFKLGDKTLASGDIIYDKEGNQYIVGNQVLIESTTGFISDVVGKQFTTTPPTTPTLTQVPTSAELGKPTKLGEAIPEPTESTSSSSIKPQEKIPEIRAAPERATSSGEPQISIPSKATSQEVVSTPYGAFTRKGDKWYSQDGQRFYTDTDVHNAVRLGTFAIKSSSQETVVTPSGVFTKFGDYWYSQNKQTFYTDSEVQKGLREGYFTKRFEVISPEGGISQEISRFKDDNGNVLITYSDNSRILIKFDGDIEIYNPSGKLVNTVKAETAQKAPSSSSAAEPSLSSTPPPKTVYKTEDNTQLGSLKEGDKINGQEITSIKSEGDSLVFYTLDPLGAEVEIVRGDPFSKPLGLKFEIKQPTPTRFEVIIDEKTRIYETIDGKEYTVDGKPATPDEVAALNKFYLEKYPDRLPSGLTKLEKIGKENLEVYYSPTGNLEKICKKGTNDCAPITAEMLKSIQNNIKGAELEWDNEDTFSFSTESKKESGKGETLVSTVERTMHIYAQDGTSKVIITNEVKNKDGTISLRETEYISEFDPETGKYKDLYRVVTNFVKKEGETISKESSDSTTVIYDAVTGKPIGLEIKQDGQTIRAGIDPENGEEFEDQNPSAQSQLSTLNNQYTARYFLASIEKALTEFQGLGYYATLFIDEDSLLKWRDNVDRIFATLYLGTEYITSSLCGVYLDGQDEGIAYAETPQGLAQVAAHVEATKTEPIKVNAATQFIYKITFSVRNGDYAKDPRAPEEMKINVVLKGQKTVNVFKKDQVVKRGNTLSRAGRAAIVQESNAVFDKVCLKFDQIPFRWKVDNKEICNDIQVSSGQPTSVVAQPSATASGTNPVPDDINDF